jgi:hypothetical protein
MREYVLNEMERQWIRATTEARHDIVAGMIRGDELELAQEELDHMQRKGISVQPWLNVLLMHSLCEKRDFEAILRLVYKLRDSQTSIKTDLPRPTWLYLLQQASEQGEYHLTEWIWRHHVEPMYIEPDIQSCVNALKLAAREGKHKLAESVHGVLQEVDSKAAEEYRCLLDAAYEKSGIRRDPSLHKQQNMFSVFSKASGHDKAFFDPRLALAKRLRAKYTNHRRIERSLAYKVKRR